MTDDAFRIITHSGKAHMDELVASALLCILLDRQPEEVIRMDSREAENLVKNGLMEGGDWVLDCGMVYDPERQLFDHHHDGALDSTALLLFDEFFPELKNSRLHESIQLLSRVDTQGLQSLNDFRELDESRSYWSFSQKLLTKGFEMDPTDALRMVTEVLKDNLQFEHLRNKALIWLESPEHTEIVELGSYKVLNYLVLPPEELTSPLRSADKEMVDEHKIIAVASFDDNNLKGKALFRTGHGQDLLDFTLCRPDHTVFCHPGGFLLKFISGSDKEWIRLVEESLLPERPVLEA
ncbi:MYG1 family protein [Oceanispirochaeta sp.]|jgi:hypothetical protein|uniref:MYG1 family protein n=1 Tax=Oceanispirochaeta sp. TaxID=2035350 RepID=UPI0026343733|nr:MYG1 family protein [Oceanispirochaeta sp.]MDA3956940.1 MYG1 family protein [Oceanispirochaeta sp.]